MTICLSKSVSNVYCIELDSQPASSCVVHMKRYPCCSYDVLDSFRNCVCEVFLHLSVLRPCATQLEMRLPTLICLVALVDVMGLPSFIPLSQLCFIPLVSGRSLRGRVL